MTKYDSSLLRPNCVTLPSSISIEIYSLGDRYTEIIFMLYDSYCDGFFVQGNTYKYITIINQIIY